jgi:hypothetical protein
VWDHGFELDDLPAILAFCLQEDTRLRSYVESLHDKALTESVALGSDPDDIERRGSKNLGVYPGPNRGGDLGGKQALELPNREGTLPVRRTHFGHSSRAPPISRKV